MSCNPTRILLSNSGTTTMQVTILPDPDPQVGVTFQVDELGINETETTVAGVATFSIDTVVADNNTIWDATIQVGSNMRAAAAVQAVTMTPSSMGSSQALQNPAQPIIQPDSSAPRQHISPLRSRRATPVTTAREAILSGSAM